MVTRRRLLEGGAIGAAAGRYRIVLGSRFGGTGVDVDEDRIDCNLSVQGVRLRSNGTVDEKTVSTMMGCQLYGDASAN